MADKKTVLDPDENSSKEVPDLSRLLPPLPPGVNKCVQADNKENVTSSNGPNNGSFTSAFVTSARRPSFEPSSQYSTRKVTNFDELGPPEKALVFKLDLENLASPNVQSVSLYNSYVARSYSSDVGDQHTMVVPILDPEATIVTTTNEPIQVVAGPVDPNGSCYNSDFLDKTYEDTLRTELTERGLECLTHESLDEGFTGGVRDVKGKSESGLGDAKPPKRLFFGGFKKRVNPSEPYHKKKFRGGNKDATLAEKLNLMESGQLNDKKIMERVAKFNRLIDQQDEYERKQKLIISYKYATDTSYLRDTTPNKMWNMIKRREAWSQGTNIMIGVSAAQVMICFVVLLTQNSPINNSTLFVALIYLFATVCTNPFEVTKDCFHLTKQTYVKLTSRSVMTTVLVWAGAVVFSPLLLLAAVCVFTVTAILDLVCGKLNNISYAEMVNVIIDFIVVFTGFSVGLRSGNAVNAVQTFAGFSFIAEMDELVIEMFEVNLNALTYHVEGPGKQRKIMGIRLIVYLTVPILLGFFIYVTVANSCFAFCNE
jgi:predicted metallopeptidase